MKYIDIHTHINIQNQEVISIPNILPGDSIPENPFSVGLHPWFIEEDEIETSLDSIKLIAESDNCIAIGECGLDRPNFTKTGRMAQDKEKAIQKGLEIQTYVFKSQIEIANLANKPLIIHCVRAFPELLHIHKTEKNTTPWIIHGFRGSREEAEALANKGISVSFGKSILYNLSRNAKITEIFKALPADMIFLETDNVEEPLREISEVYKTAAILRNISVEKVEKIIRVNAEKVFNHPSFS